MLLIKTCSISCLFDRKLKCDDESSMKISCLHFLLFNDRSFLLQASRRARQCFATRSTSTRLLHIWMQKTWRFKRSNSYITRMRVVSSSFPLGNFIDFFLDAFLSKESIQSRHFRSNTLRRCNTLASRNFAAHDRKECVL